MKAKAVAYILFFWIFCFNVMAQDKDKGSIMEEVISLPFPLLRSQHVSH